MQATPVNVSSPPAAPATSSPLSLTFSVRLVISVCAAVLVFVGFVIQLGGVGKVHDDCKDVFESSTCRDLYRLYWWTTFFQLFVALATLVVLAVDVLATVRTTISTFLAISTALCILAVERFLDAEDDAAPRAAVAGYIFSTMANFVLICLVGVEMTPVASTMESPPDAAPPPQQMPVQPSAPQPQRPVYPTPQAAPGATTYAPSPSTPPGYKLPPYLQDPKAPAGFHPSA